MQKLNRTLRLLLIGPLPPPLGGTTVSFKQLVQELSARSDVDVKVINTSRRKKHFLIDVLHSIKVLFKMFSAVPRCDVISFHASDNGTLFYGPIVWIVCKVYGKPWILREFGGSFGQTYLSLSKPAKWLVRKIILDADLCLFQTKSLVKFFSGVINKPVSWYSNSRPLATNHNTTIAKNEPATMARKFVFIGHVKPTKGVHEIIALGKQLDEDIVIDVFGPLMDGMSEREFADSKVNYRGVLQPDEVIPMLKRYDVMLLPTYHSGEGYPGIILESYSVGLPVITTNWMSIPEIVDNSSGILIEPKDVGALREAILTLNRDQEKYACLRESALEKAKQFDSAIWTEKFVEYCRETFGRYR